jgi:hypothetical protein
MTGWSWPSYAAHSARGSDRFGLSLGTVRGARLAILGVVCLLGAASPAAGHDPLGRAQPSVGTTVKGSGLTRVVGFRVRDVDSGDPIPGATLSVRARDDHGSVLDATVTRVQPQLFRTTLDFPRAGPWHVGVRIGGKAVVPTSFSFDVDAVGRPSAASDGSDAALWVGAATAAVVGAAGVLAAVVVFRRRRRP